MKVCNHDYRTLEKNFNIGEERNHLNEVVITLTGYVIFYCKLCLNVEWVNMDD